VLLVVVLPVLLVVLTLLVVFVVVLEVNELACGFQEKAAVPVAPL
jgi:hypothetical protein